MTNVRERFLKAYPNVPENTRGEIIVTVNEKTYSWNSAFFEIKENTELGKKILKILEEIGII